MGDGGLNPAICLARTPRQPVARDREIGLSFCRFRDAPPGWMGRHWLVLDGDSDVNGWSWETCEVDAGGAGRGRVVGPRWGADPGDCGAGVRRFAVSGEGRA